MGNRMESTRYWHPNVGELIRMGLKIKVICTACGVDAVIDLPRLAQLKGPDYSLHNRRCRCRLTPGCSGWNRFFHNRSGVFLPFWDMTAVTRWLDDQA